MRHTMMAAVLVLIPEAGLAEIGSHLKARTSNAAAERRAPARLKRWRAGRSHWLLGYPKPPGTEQLAALAALGVKITSRVSGGVLAVSAADGTDFDELGASAADRLEAGDKVSPLLASEPGAAFIVEFHADVGTDDASALVRNAGLVVLDHPDLLPGQMLIMGGPDDAAALSEWDEVAYIFPAAPELVTGERMAACSGALTEQGMMAEYVKVSDGWGAGPLHYFFASMTARLDRSTVQSEVLRALAEWGRYAPLEFTPAQAAGAARTIEILFARGSHGDGAPFDGPGKVLAHTYYPSPPNGEPLAGDMHLDDDENWAVGTTTDLFSVALHEAGHSLGLGHSDRPGTVMYPYYRQAAGLSADDIAGIRALYGTRDKTDDPPSTPVTPELTIAIQQPAGATVTTAAAGLAVSGRAVGGSGTLQVKWRTDRGGEGAATGSTAWSIASVPLQVGANAITVTATDQAGRSASAGLSATRQRHDTPEPGTPATPVGTPPSLKITSPAFTIVSTSLASITLRGTASNDAVSVRWTTSTGRAGTAAGTSSWNVEVPLARGTNMVTVRAYAASGASSWRSLTVVRQ